MTATKTLTYYDGTQNRSQNDASALAELSWAADTYGYNIKQR